MPHQLSTCCNQRLCDMWHLPSRHNYLCQNWQGSMVTCSLQLRMVGFGWNWKASKFMKSSSDYIVLQHHAAMLLFNCTKWDQMHKLQMTKLLLYCYHDSSFSWCGQYNSPNWGMKITKHSKRIIPQLWHISHDHSALESRPIWIKGPSRVWTKELPPKLHVYKIRWTVGSKFVDCSRLNSEHGWGTYGITYILNFQIWHFPFFAFKHEECHMETEAWTSIPLSWS